MTSGQKPLFFNHLVLISISYAKRVSPKTVCKLSKNQALRRSTDPVPLTYA